MFDPKVIYEKPEEDRKDSIIRYIKYRVLQNNKNFLSAFTGPTGVGKTWATGAIAEEYSRQTGIEHDPNKHIVFTFAELLELIQNGEKDGRLKIGTIIIFDEPQVSVNARTWQSQANQALNALVSTFRHRRYIVFFATPFLEFLDLQTRTLFHAEFMMRGLDKQNNLSRIKPMFLEYNAQMNKWYRKYLKVVYKPDGKSRFVQAKLKIWEVNKPSQAWIDVYERRRKQFTDALNASLALKLEKAENKGSDRRTNGDQFVKVAELYEKYGEDFITISKNMPNVAPITLKHLVNLVKRSKKASTMMVNETPSTQFPAIT